MRPEAAVMNAHELDGLKHQQLILSNFSGGQRPVIRESAGLYSLWSLWGVSRPGLLLPLAAVGIPLACGLVAISLSTPSSHHLLFVSYKGTCHLVLRHTQIVPKIPSFQDSGWT